MSVAITDPMSIHRENVAQITAPNSLTNRKGGFLSTLASYLTSLPKSDPKAIAVKKKIINSWDDVDLIKLNTVVSNALRRPSQYESLFVEIERIVGRRREQCLYVTAGFITILMLAHDLIGVVTAFMTLAIPAMYTVMAMCPENEALPNEEEESWKLLTE